MAVGRRRDKMNGVCALLLSVFAASCAAQAAAIDVQSCLPASVEEATSKEALRSIRQNCQGTDTEGLAWKKLNQLPPPRAPKLALQPQPIAGNLARVTSEADVYFYVFESYLPDAGVERLNKLIEALGRSYLIETVEIIGSADVSELSVGADALAAARADWVQRYLQDAGVAPTLRLIAGKRPPTGAATAEGRARDRAVRIRVISRSARAE